MTTEPKQLATRSLVALVFIPVAMFVGFIVGSVLIGDPNVASSPQDWDAEWRVILLWMLIMLPAVVGFTLGVRAIKAGERSGRLGVILNGLAAVFLTVITLVSGSIEAFN